MTAIRPTAEDLSTRTHDDCISTLDPARWRWLLRASDPAHVFTPEQLTEEHRLIGQTVERFRRTARSCRRSISSKQKDWDARARAGRARCGVSGLLGVDVAEVYGGVELDKVSSMVVSETDVASRRRSARRSARRPT